MPSACGLAGALQQVPGGGLLLSGPRTTRWAISALVSRGEPDPRGRPRPIPNQRLTSEVVVDELILGAMIGLQHAPSPEEVEVAGRDMAAAADLFEARGWLADPVGYHRSPPPLVDGDVHLTRTRWLRTGYERLTFRSGFEPWPDEPGAAKWERLGGNDTVPVALLRHPDDRPWVVCLHGFGMGFPAADFSGFRVNRLHRELGLNVAAIVLPLHGTRRVEGFGQLLSHDLALGVQALAQAAWDVRRLVGWIRARSDQPVHLYGISLGANVASLTAGLEPLDGVIAGVPAVDFPDLFVRHSPRSHLPAARAAGLIGERTTSAFRVVSPLAFAPQVPWEGRAIYGALGDRFVPSRQPLALWRHWGEPAIKWYPGGHVGFMWSGKVVGFVGDRLAELGPDDRGGTSADRP